MPASWPFLATALQWVWDNFGEEIKKEVAEPARQAWTAITWPEKANAYGEKIKTLYGTLRILGHPRPIPLTNVFTDVFIHERPLASRRTTVADLEQQYRISGGSEWGVKRVNGVKLVKKTAKLFILGQPGSGKTTFLKHIALQAANGQFDKVPIFVALKELADSGQPLLDFLVAQLAILDLPDGRPYLLRLLQAGKAIVLFDGLDEVTQEQEERLHLKTALNNFARQYDKNQMLITCRTAATYYQFEPFTYVEMADFAEEQVATFVGKWFTDNPDKGKACLAELNKPDHRGLRELARSPLLLSLLCINYEETLHFPERRVELYEEAIDALLKKWDASRDIKRSLGTEVYRKLSLGRKRQLLARIAAITFEQGKYFIPKAEMVYQILEYLKIVPETGELDENEGEAVLRAIEAQHGILVERARGVYGFAHLSFQEYFTAKYMTEVGGVVMFAHCAKSQWREVFLLTASLLGEADGFFGLFDDHLNQWVSHEPELLALLTWANDKARHGGESASALILHRTLYIYLARNLDFDPGLGLAFDLAYDRDLDLYHALKNVFGLARFLNARGNDPGLARSFSNGLYHALRPLVALDFALGYGWRYRHFGMAEPFIELALRISREQGLLSLQNELERLPVPGEDAPKNQCEEFAEALWQLAQQERQLQQFELSGEQADRLADYLQGTTLLVECLKLAAVTDREGIMRRLLAPPEVV